MTRADGVTAARHSTQSARGGSTPTSALSLFIRPIPFLEAKEKNALWHSRLPRFGTGFVKDMPFPSFGAFIGDECFAVAIWSNPCARLLPQKEWMELRRMAVAPGAPRNTPSRMLAVMTRILRRDRPGVVRLISYQDTSVHTGTIYKAAGWIPTTLSGSGDWNRPNSRNQCGTPRTRPKAQSEAPKQRWDKPLIEVA